MQPSPQAKHEKWHQELSKWQQSAMSVAAYCRQANIPDWKFYYWRKKLLPPVPATPSSFIELTLVEEDLKDSSGLWFELPAGVRLMVDLDFNSATLLQVLSVIGELKC